jgi:hypothetical protein
VKLLSCLRTIQFNHFIVGVLYQKGVPSPMAINGEESSSSMQPETNDGVSPSMREAEIYDGCPSSIKDVEMEDILPVCAEEEPAPRTLEIFSQELFHQAFPNFIEPEPDIRVSSIGKYFYYLNGKIYLTDLDPNKYHEWKIAFQNMLRVPENHIPRGPFATLWKDFFTRSIQKIHTRHQLFTAYPTDYSILNLLERCLVKIDRGSFRLLG